MCGFEYPMWHFAYPQGVARGVYTFQNSGGRRQKEPAVPLSVGRVFAFQLGLPEVHVPLAGLFERKLFGIVFWRGLRQIVGDGFVLELTGN
jgi:hypothetical protein